MMNVSWQTELSGGDNILENCKDIYPRQGKAGNSGGGIPPKLTRQHPSSKASTHFIKSATCPPSPLSTNQQYIILLEEGRRRSNTTRPTWHTRSHSTNTVSIQYV